MPVIDSHLSVQWLLGTDQELTHCRNEEDSWLLSQGLGQRGFKSEPFRCACILNRKLERPPVARCAEVLVTCRSSGWKDVACTFQIASNGSNAVSDLLSLSYKYKFLICMTEDSPYCKSPRKIHRYTRKERRNSLSVFWYSLICSCITHRWKPLGPFYLSGIIRCITLWVLLVAESPVVKTSIILVFWGYLFFFPK